MQAEVARIARFLSVGMLNTLVGFSIIFGSKWMLEWTDLWANALGYTVGLCVGFTLNRSWTFEIQDGQIVERSRRYLVTFFMAYLVNVVVLMVGLNVLEINSYLAQVLTMPFYSAVFYLLCRKWVFRTPIGTENTGKLALVTAAVIAVLCVPITQSVMPPLTDYPNHLARAYIAQHIDYNVALQSFYAFEWRALTNIGFDIGMYLLYPLLDDIYLAGQTLNALYIALLISGAMVLHRTWSGHWSYTPLLVSLVAYNGCFLAGFISFCLGVALTLWAASGWFALRGHSMWLRLAYGTTACLALYLCHLFAFGTFGLLVGCAAVQRVAESLRASQKPNVSQRRDALAVLGCTLCMAIPTVSLHYVTSPPLSASESVHYQWAHLEFLSWPVFSPLLFAQLLGLLLVVGIGVVVLLHSAYRVIEHSQLMLCVLLGLWLVCPSTLWDTHYVQVRFLIILAVVLPIVWTPPLELATKTRGWSLVLGGVAVLSSTFTHAAHWRRYDAVSAEMLEIASQLPNGSTVEHIWKTPYEETREEGTRESPNRSPFHLDATFQVIPPSTHVSSVAAIERHAFVPTLFTHPKKQLLRAQTALAPLDRMQSTPLRLRIIESSTDYSQSIFKHPSLQPYQYLLISYASTLSAQQRQWLTQDTVVQGEWFWLLQNPNL